MTRETSNAPVHITNAIGQIMLAKGGTPTPRTLFSDLHNIFSISNKTVGR